MERVVIGMIERDLRIDIEAEEAGSWNCFEAGEDCYFDSDEFTEDEALFG